MAHAARGAFNLSACFEAAESLWLCSLMRGFQQIETGVSDVLEVLDNIWEAARVAGFHFRASKTRCFITMTTFNIAERRFQHE
jgi:hypothetical protein